MGKSKEKKDNNNNCPPVDLRRAPPQVKTAETRAANMKSLLLQVGQPHNVGGVQEGAEHRGRVQAAAGRRVTEADRPT